MIIKNKNVLVFKKEDKTEKADWIFAIRIIGNKRTIEETTDFFKNHNVDIRPFFYPINKQPIKNRRTRHTKINSTKRRRKT